MGCWTVWKPHLQACSIIIPWELQGSVQETNWTTFMLCWRSADCYKNKQRRIPWTTCKCARQSACGFCWNRIHVLIDTAGPLSYLPQARWVLRPNTFLVLSRNRAFVRRGWLSSASQVEGFSLIINDLIPSHALMIPNKNRLDARSRLGVCTSFKNNHFREWDRIPPVSGLNFISWFRNIPF